MEKLNPYLTFPGNCEEAFNFYKAIFRREFLHMGRFADIPSDEGVIIPESKLNKIMHVSLPMGNGNILMGSDADDEFNPDITNGNNVSLSITTKNKEDADRIFEALCDGGKMNMQIGDVFWGSYYGMCTDKFGINWMISFNSHGAHDEEE